MVHALGVLPGLGGSLAFAETRHQTFLLLSHCHGWPVIRGGCAIRRCSNVAQHGSYQALVNRYGVGSATTLSTPSINVIDGVSLASAELDLDGNRHAPVGFMHGLERGRFSGTDTRSVSAPIDQLIARSIARNDRLPSLGWLSMMPKRPGDPLPIVPRAVGYRLRPIQHVCGVVSLDLRVHPIL